MNTPEFYHFDVPKHFAPYLKLALCRAQLHTAERQAEYGAVDPRYGPEAIELDRLAVVFYQQLAAQGDDSGLPKGPGLVVAFPAPESRREAAAADWQGGSSSGG